MLGEHVRVKVAARNIGFASYNKRKVPISTGFICDEKYNKDKTVYILGGVDNSSSVIKSKINAVFTKNDGDESYMIAPPYLTFYEPYIKDILSPYIDFSQGQLVCLHEKSCGAVIFRKKSGNIEYLLVKNKKGKNWGFPKGHVEFGETEEQTAIREVKEETGLNIEPLDGFRVVSEYHPRGRVTKKVVFFLSELHDGEITIQQSEIDRVIWADYGLAQRTFRFNNDRSVLTHARDWLGGRR